MPWGVFGQLWMNPGSLTPYCWEGCASDPTHSTLEEWNFDGLGKVAKGNTCPLLWDEFYGCRMDKER
jgi:hypothetical protein